MWDGALGGGQGSVREQRKLLMFFYSLWNSAGHLVEVQAPIHHVLVSLRADRKSSSLVLLV